MWLLTVQNAMLAVMTNSAKFLKVSCCILLLLVAIPALAASSNALRIVDDGKPHAVIITAPTASEQVRNAAKTLQEYIWKASQAEILITDNAKEAEGDQIHIWVGASKYVSTVKPLLEKMDDDGLLISFPTEKDIVIIGPTDWGTEFGVYEFLERYIGVRWLFPGPAGEYVPLASTIEVPKHTVRQEPAFFSRQFSGLIGPEQRLWVRRNRLHGRINFMHNLFRLFPPEQYTKTHPEFFPIHRGKRYLPKDNKVRGNWQPCFTAPGIVDEAVKNITAYFAEHPDATWYSLGVNDGGAKSSGHCECDRCRLQDSGGKNSLGRKDRSDRYFIWANAVVEKVLEKYPDKWFGCLAYSEIADPPSQVKVHPRIVPVLCYDRMKWADSEIKQKRQEITERWKQQVPKIGWYDYIFGTPYLLPRVYLHTMAEYYKYAAEHGVNAMCSAAYPNWGEGPKMYIASKLQWNPNQNVNQLLHEWYEYAVGKQAAPYLAAYYRLWEEFWTDRIPAGKWFTRNKEMTQYLYFGWPKYLDQISFEDIENSRTLLAIASENVQTKGEEARIQYLLKAFEFYEASALSYLGLKKGMRQARKKSEYYQMLNKRRYDLVKRFASDSVLKHPLRFDSKRFSEGFAW
ncbi:MAG: DUF4838 domain-containing protein [Candidatus Electrothrix sp. AW3_4]|nr:DUF4838 domain-containing protein [Candidatus Electrothrix gigas]